MGNRGIEFDDWGGPDLERHLRELARGRLPGRWGLLQELVGHWAIPRQERGWLRLGKAALDSLGTVLAFRDAQRQVVDGARSPSLRWLQERGFHPAFSETHEALRSFVRSSLSGLEFREKRVRGPSGELDEVSLRELAIGGGRVAYFLDPCPRSQEAAQTAGWLGPYCRAEDRAALLRFVRDTVWERLGTETLLLGVAPETGPRREANFRLDAVSDDFGFASGCDAFNDLDLLGRRCQAFLDNGCHRTLLFHGPPGTGKSTLARALARQLGRRVVLLASDVIALLSDATTTQILGILEPGVVVLNDVDRLSDGEQVSLLHGLEQATEQPTLTVLTGNDVECLDPAALRPGRVHEVREVTEPSRGSRAEILAYYVARHGLQLSREQVELALDRSDGFSPADLREFCDTAAAVGVPLALEELERIGEQRALYAGDRCQQYNRAPAGPAPGRRRRRRRRRAAMP